MVIRRLPAAALAGRVTAYHGFAEQGSARVTRREGPGREVVVIISLADGWLIDGEPRTSFVRGLRQTQVTTEHPGATFGLQVSLEPPHAHALLRMSMHELAGTTIPLDDLLGEPRLADRLHDAPSWDERFAILDHVLTRRLADARPSPEIAWAWARLRHAHGNRSIGELGRELGWSRKRLVARFREEVGLAPKAAAQLLRFERARELAGSASWAEVAREAGYYDQSHLVAAFQAFTGRSPGSFLLDEAEAAA